MSTHPIFGKILADVQAIPTAVANATAHPVPVVVAEFAAEQSTELDRLRLRAENAEFAARQNAETIAGQQQHVRQIEGTNARLRQKLDHITADLDTAVITLRNGTRRTLRSIFEAGDYEDLCRVCTEPECRGIDAHPGIVRREAAEDEGDES